jgi:hypothetical protein
MEPLDVRDVDEPERPGGPGGASAVPPASELDRAGHLSFVAHETRNPLATALWTAELLARMPGAERAGPRGDKLSAMCLRSVLRVRQIVEDHFLSERLDTGGFPLRIEAVGLADVVGAVLERRPPDASPVTTTVDPALAVLADRALLERAVDSLVAVAGGEGTRVSLSTREGAGGEVILVVSGRAAERAALADPKKGAPTDPTGRALSAPLARRIAAALGGSLDAAGEGWLLALPGSAEAPTPEASGSP